mmetsp:Transcript_3628/g.7802  ORF Transcript_3628/g.7802 Transcript_3628/m.7802 type:complete len:125 (-) Transcript_3628:185-559(-)
MSRPGSPLEIYTSMIREYRNVLKVNPYARALNCKYVHERKPHVYVKRPLSSQVVVKTTEWPVEKQSFMNLLKPKLGFSRSPKRIARSAGGSFTHKRDIRSRARRRLESASMIERNRQSSLLEDL